MAYFNGSPQDEWGRPTEKNEVEYEIAIVENIQIKNEIEKNFSIFPSVLHKFIIMVFQNVERVSG